MRSRGASCQPRSARSSPSTARHDSGGFATHEEATRLAGRRARWGSLAECARLARGSMCAMRTRSAVPCDACVRSSRATRAVRSSRATDARIDYDGLVFRASIVVLLASTIAHASVIDPPEPKYGPKGFPGVAHAQDTFIYVGYHQLPGANSQGAGARMLQGDPALAIADAHTL